MPKQFNSAFLFVLIAGVCVQCKAPVRLPAGDPGNGGLILPDGFEALVVVDSIGRARHLAVNKNGDIYVKLEFNDSMKGRGGTVGLRDTNNDGKADSIAYFGDYTDVGGSAVGMTIHDGYLYTSSVTLVLRNKLTPGELVPSSKTEVMLTDSSPNVAHHWHTTKPVAFDKDGNMYVPFGAPTDAGQDLAMFGPAGIPGGHGLDPCPDLVDYGGIWKFNAGKTGQTQKDGERYATGLRSIVGMTWSPLDNSLYAVVNGIDNFHTRYPKLYTAWQAAVLPAETLVKVKKGNNFGWPYAYYDQMQGKNVLQPGYGGDGKIVGRAGKFDVPVMGFPGHWAPMDLLFYQGSQFPARYKNGVFVAFHGSTDRSPYSQAGFIVVFIPFTNGAPEADLIRGPKWEVFADGFAGVDTVANTSDANYRPMGLAEGPDGSLYISESNKGKIWRVMYKGDKNEFRDAQLTKMEERKSREYIKTPDSMKDDLHTGSIMEGGILFNSYCATCHQRNGKGDNSRYPPLSGSELVKGDKDVLIKIVLYGLQGRVKVNGRTWDGVMPAHAAVLDDQAVASILTYVRKRFGNNSSNVSSTDIAKNRK
jgi:glucose/arabinose dehydrogenase/mono/diheme cytochrome c family protein